MESLESLHTLQLTLHATVPSSRHAQLLHILAGIAGHPPVPVLERHLIFRPTATAARSIAADEGGGTQNVVDREKARRRAEREAREKSKSAGIVRYVEEVKGLDFENSVDGEDESGSTTKETRWSYRFYDVPDPNTRTVTMRKSEKADVGADVVNLEGVVKEAESKGLRFASQYVITGSQFVYSNIVLLLHKPLLPPSPNNLTAQLNITKPGISKDLKTLDPSDAFILEARLEILDEPGKPPSNDLVSQGLKELGKFKDLMKGVVEIKVVERMSLNTKVA